MQIDKNIPIPAPAIGTRGNAKWKLHEMGIGDSIAVNTNNPANLNCIIMRTKKKTGFDFCRRYKDGVLRVWRIS